MKRTLLIACLVFFQQLTFSQVKLPVYPDSLFTTYYNQKASFAATLPVTKDDIVFLGNSITDGAVWSELFNDIHVKSRGFSGDISAGIIHRFENIVDRKPSKIFLLIGTNDLAKGITEDSLLKNIFILADYLRQESPATNFFVQSILPVNDHYGLFKTHTKNNDKINSVNAILKNNAIAHHYKFIDLHSAFSDAEGKMNIKYSNDGLHLLGPGYFLWKHLVYADVYDLQQSPSIIPLPQNLQWNEGDFPLFSCKNILIKDASLQKEGERLQGILAQKGWSTNIVSNLPEGEFYIELNIANVYSALNSDEAYQLKVTDDKILITANTAHGIFNAIETLQQLLRDGSMVNNCTISDWPAFVWRSYMVDVGRNYQSIQLLKKQIDVMAMLKLNFFHFHSTEDIAWRFAIKQYPQLVAPENMTRNKGMYYTPDEIKELINYCKERYINFVPEIDMPGHSAAFTRAFKTDMQTDSGIAIIKNILKKIFNNYDIDYLHIGADEVKITNHNFIPEITAYVKGFGKKIIGWEPGGNFSNDVIRQLWKGDEDELAMDANIQYIDSRHLYINHIDPLESVVTIFNRKILDKDSGDKNSLGATLCLWPDRAVAKEDDIFRMNPVYPDMLAFAERTWRGGGQEKMITNIGQPGTDVAINFAAFENRMMDIQKEELKHLPFPYQVQSNMVWKLFGPFDNGGNTGKLFGPENKKFSPDTVTNALQTLGGTIVLRHWWYPLVNGVLKNPKENSTWYASTKLWSDEEGYKNFWIGFNNLSRSPATDSPPLNKWDEKNSEVWVNGSVIAPPQWLHAGQKGNSEIPLVDEGYEYREPTKILLHKGWNTVLIKAPIGSFKGADWQNPVKWMFTFIQL